VGGVEHGVSGAAARCGWRRGRGVRPARGSRHGQRYFPPAILMPL